MRTLAWTLVVLLAAAWVASCMGFPDPPAEGTAAAASGPEPAAPGTLEVRQGWLSGAVGEVRDLAGPVTHAAARDEGWAVVVHLLVERPHALAMAVVTLGGGLTQPGLALGTRVVVAGPERRAGERLYVKVLGRAGTRSGQWTYDQPADDVELTVLPGREANVRTFRFVAHWWDDGAASEGRGFSTVLSGSFDLDVAAGGQGNWGPLATDAVLLEGALGTLQVPAGTAADADAWGDGNFAHLRLTAGTGAESLRLDLVFDSGIDKTRRALDGRMTVPSAPLFSGYVPLVRAVGSVGEDPEHPAWHAMADEVDLEELPSPGGPWRALRCTLRWLAREPGGGPRRMAVQTATVQFAVVPPG